MSEILTGGDIAALRPFGDNGFRVGDRFYSVREMLDTIARAFAERDALGEALVHGAASVEREAGK